LQAYQGRRIVALCGMLKDKDITSVLATLAEQISHWNFVSLDIPRGASAQTLRQALPNDACRDRASEFVDISSAWHAIQTTVKADDVVIVFGSFYTVAGFKLL